VGIALGHPLPWKNASTDFDLPDEPVEGGEVEMTLPNAAHATLPIGKLSGFLLNVSHKRGAAKAKPLLRLGYRAEAPRILEMDLRSQHLTRPATRTSGSEYAIVYMIEGPIRTPSGKTVRFCSIWQVDIGSETPRFITMYPR
jgi:Domain of unknown function (DUF6883)